MNELGIIAKAHHTMFYVFLGGVCNHKSFLPRPDMRADNTEQSINPPITVVSRKC